jgi:hypothetical protein
MEDFQKPWTPPPEPPPAPGLPFGEFLLETFRLLRSRLPVFLLTALICVLFMALVRNLSGRFGALPSFALNYLSILVFLACSAACASAARGGKGDTRPEGPSGLKPVFLRLPRQALLSAVFFPPFLLVMFSLGLGIAMWFSSGASPSTSSFHHMYLLCPLAALALAGFVHGAFCLAAPAAVLEGSGPISSLVRSLELTRGSRLKASVFFIAVYIASAATSVIASAVSSWDSGVPDNSLPALAVYLVLTLLLLAASAAFWKTRLNAFKARESQTGDG